MSRRMIRHLVSAGIGVAAAPSIAFLFLDGVMRTLFLTTAMLTDLPLAPPGIPLASAWLAALEFAAAGALAGALAGAGWVSPVAPLVAGLPLLAIHFYAHSSMATLANVMRHTPAGLGVAIQEAAFSNAFLLIGGALTVSALAPWRWRTNRARPSWANWHAVGVIAGMAAVPALWLVLQLSEGATRGLGPPGIVTSEIQFQLFMFGGAIVMGLLASARWLSPVAALIAGTPLLAVGLFALLMPATAQNVIVRIVYGEAWQPATESFAASGWLVLFGGMVMAAGITSGRWRREAGPVPAEGALTPGPALGPAPDPELAP